jgi:hypothetical protein
MNKLVSKATTLSRWFELSGMVVNMEKTELCIFSRGQVATKSVLVENHPVLVKNEMKVLGITFDSQLKWDKHILKTLNSCSKLLFALRIVKQSLDVEQVLNVATSIFYSKMYYGCIVWLHKNTSSGLKNKLLSMSAKCLMICLGYKTSDRKAFAEIHMEAKRATPKMMQLYVHACFMYKIIHNLKPPSVFNKLILTFLNEHRNPNPKFTSINKLRVGYNSLHNRLAEVSQLVNFDWTSLSYPTFKIKAKELFLAF